MVTRNRHSLPFETLDEDQCWSIRLAVAQWLRSPRATSDARDHLLELGISEDEVLRRRRAESADSGMAGLLRLAVTIAITRGRLEAADHRRLPTPVSDAALRTVVNATVDAYARILLAESSQHAGPADDLNMDVGDY